MTNWDHIKKVWVDGVEDLNQVAKDYGVTMPEIALRAKTEGWGDRGYSEPFVKFSEDVLTDKDVILAHKTDLGRLRLVAAVVLETLDGETDINIMLKTTDKLVKIYNQLIPLERKVFGIDSDGDGSPDAIIINMKK